MLTVPLILASIKLGLTDGLCSLSVGGGGKLITDLNRRLGVIDFNSIL